MATAASRSRLRDAARAIAPIGVAALVFGASFGLLARAAGMGEIAPIVMSATTFAGSAQFAAASVLDAAGGALAAIAAGVLLNVRYAPMSVAAGPGFSGSLWRRLLASQMIVDESWALAARGGGRFDAAVIVGGGLLPYPCWIGGTAVGVVAGEALGDPERLGLGAAFPALFLALLVPMLRNNRRAAAAAVAGGAVALALLPFAPDGVPIVAASAACLIGWRR